MTLPFSLERTVLIRARRGTVFRYFSDSERFATWWGAGSSIDARPGGAVRICYPNGVVASGLVEETIPDERIVFTYGYEDPTKPIAPGASRVTVSFEDREDGTLVRLRHDVASQAARDAHVPGWRFQLSLFAVAVASEVAATVTATVDDWFLAFSSADAAVRLAILDRVATGSVAFRDRYACLAGRDDVDAHIAALQQMMPSTITRDGELKACQGQALVRWTAGGMRGTNVFDLDADGRIASVVGYWD